MYPSFGRGSYWRHPPVRHKALAPYLNHPTITERGQQRGLRIHFAAPELPLPEKISDLTTLNTGDRMTPSLSTRCCSWLVAARFTKDDCQFRKALSVKT